MFLIGHISHCADTVLSFANRVTIVGDIASGVDEFVTRWVQTPSDYDSSSPQRSARNGSKITTTGGKGSLTQWVHCEFVVSFEAIRPVITQRICGEFF